ncbi:MAG: ATP-binding cassette domain-containing protein [Saprospiraceae bacterium]|nr:MAG: ATP-binding cassette domain-containing protein [Saprospiraceae bacterium]
MNNHTIVLLREVSIFQNEAKILSNVNLHIMKGEFVYLIGKTGSGKSSLLKTLYAALPVTQGSASVAGFDLKTLTRKTIPLLRRKLGIVFQDFNLLNDRTVEQNLLFSMKAMGWKDKAKMQKRLEELLEKVGLKGKNQKMPHALSGGEQQRVVIARALLNDPELLIADEPTGNLDPETSDDILLLLRKLANEHNTAVLFGTHDYRILEHFPARIIRCHDGRVIDEEEVVM